MKRSLVLTLIAASFITHARVSAQSPDRSKPPAPGAAPILTLPQIHKRQLPNGLPVWIVEAHEVPVVQVNLVVRGGTANDPPGKFGLASLMTAMLTEGAGARSSLELADALDFLGAEVNASSSFDAMAVRLHVPVARLSEALPIMADIVRRPTFPRAELDRLRQQRLTALLQSRDDAATIASLALSRVLYGQGRFGTAAMGTEATLRAFTIDDLRSFYTSRVTPATSTLVVVGDVRPDAVVSELTRQFGDWTSPAAALPPQVPSPRPAPPARTQREVFLVDKPGAPQSQIRIGIVGVARSTPDYFPLQVVNTVLGGSFSSRLNLNLREDKGYTYGASSSFDMRLEPGPFTAGAGVQTDKTSESLQEFFKELNAIRQPVPAEELTRAKNYVALRFPGGFETAGDISRRLEEAIIYNLPDEYFSSYVPGISRTSVADAQRVSGSHIQPDRVAVVVVGDLKVIEPGIRALNLGPITTMTVDQIFQ